MASVSVIALINKLKVVNVRVTLYRLHLRVHHLTEDEWLFLSQLRGFNPRLIFLSQYTARSQSCCTNQQWESCYKLQICWQIAMVDYSDYTLAAMMTLPTCQSAAKDVQMHILKYN